MVHLLILSCLFCKNKSSDIEKVKEHYLKFHNVDQNNIFFKKLIDQNEKKKKNVIYRRNCNDCTFYNGECHCSRQQPK